MEMNFWTPEKTSKLVELWPTRSARFLAKEFGTTRNAIIGKVTRLGLKKGHEQKRERIAVARIGRRRDPMIRNPKPREDAASDFSESILNEPFLGVHLLDLRTTQCRYIKEPSSLVFCGHLVRHGSSYCSNHHRHMFTEKRNGA